jgi:hypothetical protein
MQGLEAKGERMKREILSLCFSSHGKRTGTYLVNKKFNRQQKSNTKIQPPAEIKHTTVR